MVLSGSTVRNEHVQLLATMLEGDDLAAKLERAIVNKNSIVALSLDDRKRIADLLAVETPAGLAELRSVIVAQLKRHKEREAQDERMRLNQGRLLPRQPAA
jgi:hypothetical protein